MSYETIRLEEQNGVAKALEPIYTSDTIEAEDQKEGVPLSGSSGLLCSGEPSPLNDEGGAPIMGCIA